MCPIKRTVADTSAGLWLNCHDRRHGYPPDLLCAALTIPHRAHSTAGDMPLEAAEICFLISFLYQYAASKHPKQQNPLAA